MINSKEFDYLIRNYWDLLDDEDKDIITKEIKKQKQSDNYALTSENIDFQNDLVKRVKKKSQVFFNYCPVCGELARTKEAKQAPCGHRWL